MSNVTPGSINYAPMVLFSVLAWPFCLLPAQANPTGGTVAQGSASFNTSGSQFTINQTSASAFINWSSFNIGAGETTTFVQPSASSVAWNQINDANLSQILGNLNANGYVVLQNPNGFYVGGQASISTHGLVMTTAPTPSLSSGGAWQFDTPPPAAKIINYGQINIAGGNPVFLIANDVENKGTISAPGGKIGLYAGEQVLVSTSPDGRGLSAKVTLPQGSVDNEGNLIADGGSIIAQAQTVNNNGLVQADSVQNNNGVIELVASDNVNLGANSVISAQGESTGISSGGAVTIKSDNAFSDQAGSTINISGGAQGGNGGQVEISAPQMSSIQSVVKSQAAVGYAGGALTIDPANVWLASATTDPSAPTGYTVIDVNNYSGVSTINVSADNNITLNTLWTLAGVSAPATLNLSAGNNITLNDGTGIVAGKNWNVNLTAGTSLPSGSQPTSGNDGIYLNGAAYLQALNGDITLSAANEVQVGWAGSSQGAGAVNPGTGSISTTGGGGINVTTQHGDINTGSDYFGYLFGQKTLPYYQVSPNLGGISTADGGNVTLTAGGDVISFLPLQSNYSEAKYDGGTGAFGSSPGNVMITAGGNVYGHYVVADGTGTITAGANIGAPLSTVSSDPSEGFALSLIAGSWNVYAPNGSIYVQDVRNPNGIFGEKNAGSSPSNYAGYHDFDYAQSASVLFDAGDAVEIVGFDLPHDPPSQSSLTIPLIFPPSLTVEAGAGGFILDAIGDITGVPVPVVLFPSPDQSLNITTINGGNFGIPNDESPYSTDPVTLEMSASSATRWTSVGSFGTSDNSPTLLALDNTQPVEISIAGSMNDVNLYTTKATQITVGGDMINCGFNGQNRASTDVTSIQVTGNIYNSPADTFVSLTSGIVSANPNQPTVWNSVFNLAVSPGMVQAISSINVNNLTEPLAKYLKDNNYLLFPSDDAQTELYGVNPGFIYDSNARILGFQGVMSVLLSAAQIAVLENGTFTVLVADANGNPVVNANGNLETTTYHFSAASVIATLDSDSQTSANLTSTLNPLGYQIGGPGQFDIQAASINLGNTPGIASLGFDGNWNQALSSLLPTPATGGASVTVTVKDGDLNMITSSIYSEDGGNVIVNAAGEIDLSEGTQGRYFDFKTTDCYGIYTSGHSDVSVTADGNINVGSARIATFDGGKVFVESLNGDVNAGSGVTEALNVFGVYINPATGLPASVEFGDYTDASTLLKNPPPYGSGILAEIPTKLYQTDKVSEPGNIVVETPNGNIVSTSGGISQLALNGSIQGPSVTLSAGIAGTTSPTDANAGNILLGAGGVVGGQVDVTATGKINGYFVSQQNLNITGLSFTGLGLAGQTANVSASEAGTGPAIIVGIGSVNATGLGSGAELLGQNVSANGGPAQSTLGSSVNASSASQNAASESSSEAKSQVASNDNGSEDDQKKKKLLQKVKRVTVILPKT